LFRASVRALNSWGHMGDLVLNPNVRIRTVKERDQIIAAHVWAPVRQASLQYNELNRDQSPRIFDFVRTVLANDRDIHYDKDGEHELERLGILVEPRQISRRVRFNIPCIRLPDCPADSTPPCTELICQDSLTEHFPWPIPDRDWRQFCDCVSSRDRLVWHQATPLSVVHPWRFSGKSATHSVLRPVNARLSGLPDSEVISHSDLINEGRRQRFDDEVRSAHEHFSAKGYATFSPNMPPPQLRALQNYYTSLVREGWMRLGDSQSHRYWTHNDPIARNLQLRMLGLVRALTGRAVKPSYTYAVRYLQGAELPAHRDRLQCQYTITLLLDFECGNNKESPWPLVLYPDGGGPVTIRQEIANAVIYRGPEIVHARPRLMECSHSTSVILHYVDETFGGNLD
jgi:hypothetical protein